VAVLVAKAHSRVLAFGFARTHPAFPRGIAQRSPLATVWRQLDRTLATFIEDEMIAT
jgi:hypothetical protein